MELAVFIISVVCIYFLLRFFSLKLQLRDLRRQLEYRKTDEIKKPLALEIQDKDVTALTAALNQIFKQDEKFRINRNLQETEFKQLITNISHDLRTPLTVLKGYLQLLERCETDTQGRKYLSVCFRHTDELERRIRQFFEYSYWLNQDDELHLKTVNLTNLIIDTMTDFIPVFEEKGLRMKLTDDTVYKGRADEELIKRIMQNLLKNCLQYSTGEVELSILKGTKEPLLSSQTHIQKDRICVCVKNPIDKNSELDASKIFQRFYVGNKERNKSTGLGLSIVKILVEKMEGEVFAMREGNILCIGFYLDAE